MLKVREEPASAGGVPASNDMGDTGKRSPRAISPMPGARCPPLPRCLEILPLTHTFGFSSWLCLMVSPHCCPSGSPWHRRRFASCSRAQGLFTLILNAPCRPKLTLKYITGSKASPELWVDDGLFSSVKSLQVPKSVKSPNQHKQLKDHVGQQQHCHFQSPASASPCRSHKPARRSQQLQLFSTVFCLHSLTNQELLVPTSSRLSQQAFWP